MMDVRRRAPWADTRDEATDAPSGAITDARGVCRLRTSSRDGGLTMLEASKLLADPFPTLSMDGRVWRLRT